jgi:ATP-dependent Lhr-like helicase
VQKNLVGPLEAILDLAAREGLSPERVRVQVRTGDTPASERAQMVRRPPHVLITTPESLYLVLTSPRSRETLRHADTVIVDEIHALVPTKREATWRCQQLQADTTGFITAAKGSVKGASLYPFPGTMDFAAFLTGGEPCAVVQVGHLRQWQLSLETPEDALSAVATHEMWGQIYDRLVELVGQHRTTLIFSNIRKLAERVANDLGARLGPGTVSAHHGSMARELRLAAEEKLKRGELRAMVATASLELGIDIGAVDLVVQLGSPRSIALFLQRVGRAGHSIRGISKGVLFALTRDELVECTALLRAVHDGELDAVRMPQAPLDAGTGSSPVRSTAGTSGAPRPGPSRLALPRPELGRLPGADHAAEGVSERRGRLLACTHRDRVNHPPGPPGRRQR